MNGPVTKVARLERIAALIRVAEVRSQTELAEFLAEEGIQVTQVYSNNLVLQGTATNAQMASLLGVSIHNYTDGKQTPDARRYERLSHDEAIQRNLQVMDTAAFALTRDNRIPIVVFSVHEMGAIRAALLGQGRATYVMP